MLEVGGLEFDPRQAERIVRLAMFVSSSGSLTRAQLASLTDIAGLTSELEDDFADFLKAAGIDTAPSPEDDILGQPEHDALQNGSAVDFKIAVRAAKAVLDSDRRGRRRDRYILSAEEEAGLVLLLRRDTSTSSDLPAAFVSGLDRGTESYAAFEALVMHNVRLVHSIVLAHLHRGLEHEDLFQHGVIGLIRAIRRFDVTMGLKLSTYATWWIRQSLTRAIADEGSLVRLPVHAYDDLLRIKKLMRVRANGEEKTDNLEISLALGISVDKVEFYLRFDKNPVSLDLVPGGVDLLDVFGTAMIARLPTPEDFISEWTSMQWLMDQLAELTDKEAGIVSCRIGLTTGEPMTLDAIGEQFGVTRERIRQIEQKALNKLRIKHGVPEHGRSRLRQAKPSTG